MEPAADINVVPATADRWADVVAVFGSRGDPARCWCQWFFDGSQIGSGEVAAANGAALKAQMQEAPAPGVLAYDGEQPAGWCAVAPRPGYGRLRRGPLLRGTASSSASLYHGPLSTFMGAGFAEVTRPTASRAVVRLVL